MRKIITFILIIILFIIECLTILSFSISNICTHTIASNVVKKQISSKTIEIIKTKYPKISNSKLEKIEVNIQNSDEIYKITKLYFDDIIKNNGNDKKNNVNINKHIKLLINENSKYLTDEQKKEIANIIKDEKTFDSVYLWVSNNLSDDQKQAVDMYNFIDSDMFKIILGVLFAFISVVIICVLKSFLKYVVSLGISFILSGTTIVFIIPKLIDILSKRLTFELLGSKGKININSTNNYGYILLITGVIIVFIYIISKLLKKKKTA